ncbi:adenylate kinase 8 isoform X1 [Diorhabda carinulata]|uniref:adenylate kinase 8 isoform X1 n=1 Tax=Diorhabda carinulata TaxID=1163345 RepID=UPI0025A0EA1A|nr:adenylate kinase 8 isoform X1 [Diorhabda carinulata]
MSSQEREKLPMRFPLWHVPYLEKHRIFNLFHEIARELVINKPSDHLLFTKQIILNAAKSREIPRILFLPSPKINLLELATEVSKLTKQVVISREKLIGCLNKDFDEVRPEVLAKGLAYLVRQENCYSKGWIMVDCLRNEADAKHLLQLGIIPTHTFHLIAPFHPNINDILYCKVSPHWPEQRRLLVALRNIFKNSLREVHLKHRHIAEIIAEIIDTAKIRKLLRPIKPRVLLLGPRGSGRKTQAVLLSHNLNIVFIDFEYLLCQAWISPTELGKKLRECQNEVCFHSDLLAQVVNQRILQDDCLTNGYVLVGFPYTDTDFKYFDSLDTPPNRVIFIECDLNVCRERIRYRRLNTITGSLVNIKENPTAEKEKELVLHPKDDIHMINAELNYYCQNYGSLRKYCGPTAKIVNGDLSIRAVNETITAIILRASTAFPPRKGMSAEDTKSMSSSDDSCGCPVVSSKIVDCFIKQL